MGLDIYAVTNYKEFFNDKYQEMDCSYDDIIAKSDKYPEMELPITSRWQKS